LNSTAYGCDCAGPDTFCEIIELQIGEREYIVVKATTLGAIDHGMDVRVLNSYQGEIAKDTIRVWGDNGFQCRVYTSRFKIGDTIIMKLNLIDEIFPGINDIGEKVGDYELSVCGLHYLRVNDNHVTGNITSQTQEIEIAQFEELMGNEKLFEICIETNVEETEIFKDILLYPNPVGEELSIISDQRISGIKIYNSLVQSIYKQIDINNNEFNINFSEFKVGLYLVEIVNSHGKSITKKIYKK